MGNQSPLCKYKEIFGIPGEGIHEHRTLGMGTVDWLATFALGAAIVYFTGMDFIAVMIFLTIASIIIHMIFCVDTALVVWTKNTVKSIMT